ncbi:golgin subfamily A member 6-like protein 2 isoform X2 [Oreochromis aureus]|uniref:golgin subfamily A member 6-like protein 2 isoform X2 n=1 Tax=Oreochromis aureus TaxID=47969 RepID=UPI001953A65C|nr:golgin subfamily A member 6-like protein 2 isoform X2 [Oreochromis aureus]
MSQESLDNLPSGSDSGLESLRLRLQAFNMRLSQDHEHSRLNSEISSIIVTQLSDVRRDKDRISKEYKDSRRANREETEKHWEQNTELTTRYEDIKTKNAELRREYENITKEDTELREENAELRRGYENITKEDTELREENAELRRGYNNITKEDTELKEENAELRRGYENITKEDPVLREENAELRRGYENITKKTAELKEENAELRRGYENITKKNAERREENAKLRREYENITKENAELRKTVENHQRLVEEAQCIINRNAPEPEEAETHGSWCHGAKRLLKVGLGLATAAIVVPAACWAISKLFR